MNRALQDYATIVFDCDGVLLDSNRVKTEAFRTVALQFGEPAAEALVGYHVAHGGVSRYRKFAYLLGEILGLPVLDEEVQRLAAEYGECVYAELLRCPVAAELPRLRRESAAASWMVVSGGAEFELRKVFAERGLAALFDGGIHGSPATKDEILGLQIACGALRQPALFVGDSRYDHEAAARAGLDFVFVHAWTEFGTWRDYCAERGIPVVAQVAELLAPGRAGADEAVRQERSVP